MLDPYNRKIVVDSFRKKKVFNEAEEVTSLSMGARNPATTLPSIFSEDFWKAYRKLL